MKLNNGKGNQSGHKADIQVAKAELVPTWSPTQGFALTNSKTPKVGGQFLFPEVQL